MSALAKAIVVRSSRYGPMICTPTGRPAAVPAGATVAGIAVATATATPPLEPPLVRAVPDGLFVVP